jgi:uncharacterized membrane protein YraQ (UPF0718 family)
MLVDSAFLFLIGLALAGLISTFLTSDIIARYAGRGRFRSVLRASLIGVPLPLCSCSVLPVAAQLRKSGVSKPGTTAFLIATPESGVDSIFLTYSLTDPLLTVARPVAAFATAFGAGMLQSGEETPEPQTEAQAVCEDGCGCAHDSKPMTKPPILTRVLSGLKYGFTDLIGDLAPYLFVGYLLAGLLDVLFGSYVTDLPAMFKTGLVSYAGAILVGVPLYICATSSTPLAAVLLGHGFSPGAILVLLLVGPATNVASLVVVKRILGAMGTVRYLVAIIIIAVIGGIILDRLYVAFDITAMYQTGIASHSAGWIHPVSAAILALLIVWYTGRKYLRRVRN